MTAAVRALGLGLALIALGLGGGCGEKKRTEIILGVATDLDAPDPLTLVSLEVFKLPENIPVAVQPLDISGNINNVYSLPGTFAVYSASGSADRIRVELTGVRRKNSVETKLVVRTAVLNLVPGKTLFVRLGIVTACIGKLDCGDGLTCIDGECVSDEIDSSRLPDYQPGMEARIDCAGGIRYVDTSTKQPLPITGTSCPASGTCVEGYCLGPLSADAGQDAGRDSARPDAAGDASDGGDAGGGTGGGTGGTGSGGAGGADAGVGGVGGAGGEAVALLAPAVNYTAGPGAQSVALGDLNGDGKLDLAVANYSGPTVAVLLNHGDGTFADAVPYLAGGRPNSVVLADANGDGKLDLAVANSVSGGGNGGVLLNKGDGTFGDAVGYPTDIRDAYSVALGDLNGYGKPDLVVADSGGFLRVFSNVGSGMFRVPAVYYSIGAAAFGLALGDLNGDGVLDVAAANVSTGAATVLLNAGDGTFGTAADYPSGRDTRAVALGDLNGDGKPDLALANTEGGTVSVLVNSGGGTFGAAVTYTVGRYPHWIARGDLDRDGKPDLAVTDQAGGVIVLVNNGDGTFSANRNYFTGAGATGVALGDLNGDGQADLAVTNGSNVSVFVNVAPLR